MSKLIYGCDPDSEKSGIAVYLNGRLVELQCMTLIQIFNHFMTETRHNKYDSVELHIEDLNANRCSSFNHNEKMSAGAKYKVSESVGKCKQVQVEIERIAEHFGIEIIHHKVSSQWKDSKTGKRMLEQLTGWKGKSNEDSRSSAYFGWLGVTSK